MKRTIGILLALVMLLGMMGTAYAEGEPTIRVSPSVEEAAPGDEVRVEILFENNPGIISAEVSLEYDPNVFDWVKVEEGVFATQGEYDIYDVEFDENGDPIVDEDDNPIPVYVPMKLTWFKSDGRTNSKKNGVFVTVTLKVKDTAESGTTPVTVSYVPKAIFDNKENNVYFDIAGSSVLINTTQPEPLDDGYYLIGQKGWNEAAIDPEQKFVANENKPGEYMLETGLAVGDGIKVVKVESGSIKTWYPDGMDNQYVVDAAHAGRKTIYFKPEYVNDWSAFGGYIWIDAALSVRAEVYGSSVSLKGDIALNFFLILPKELTEDEGAYVTLNDAKYPIAEAKTRDLSGVGTVHQFTIAMTAKQMNDKVTLKVFTGEDAAVPLYRHSNGEDVTSGYQYCVQDYIQDTLADPAAEAKLKTLVQAMSDYGSLAQLQFNYNTDNRAEVKGDIDSVTLEQLAGYAPQETAGEATGVTFKGPSLVLKTETAIRLYFEVTEGSAEDYTFKVGTKAVTPENTADGWMIEIPNISAKNLDKEYTVTVSSDAGTVLTVKVSALSYVYNVLNTETNETFTENLKKLVKAVYLYNQAADAYFG